MTLHDICEIARATYCVCDAAPGQPCWCQPAGVHVSRVIHARRQGWISQDDIAYVIRNFLTIVPDPEWGAA